MLNNSSKFYTLLLSACMAGYIWLYYNFNTPAIDNKIQVCIIKRITNIPCPSCGTTRSVISLFKGDYLEAILINPLGYIAAFVLLLAPPGVLIDLILKRKTLHKIYQKFETYIKKPKLAFAFIFLILINWGWNIAKEL